MSFEGAGSLQVPVENTKAFMLTYFNIVPLPLI